jgi:hypothetical protein
MPYKRTISYLILGLSLFAASTLSAIEDGFTAAKRIEGKQAVLYCEAGLDIQALVQQMVVTYTDRILTGKPVENYSSADAELADMVDILYLRVCDITDMRLYSLKVNIKISKDYNELSGIYTKLFSSDLGGRRSFYVAALNTIYISSDSFTREILGHEMAHAIISHYFVVEPPIKIQEILAMYVEYQLRQR